MKAKTVLFILLLLAVAWILSGCSQRMYTREDVDTAYNKGYDDATTRMYRILGNPAELKNVEKKGVK